MLAAPPPARPSGDPFAPRALPPGHVHLWHADLDAGPPDESVLAADERARAERMLGRARPRFVRSRELLRRLLSAYTNVPPSALDLRIGPEGKPALASGTVRFSLAHSGAAWLGAFAADRDVGVDVERMDRSVDRERVAERVFAPNEIETIRRLQGDAKTRGFFRCWTAREAIVKVQGVGMFTLAGRFEVDADPEHPLSIRTEVDEARRIRVVDIPVRPGCCAALAVDGEVARIVAFEVP